MLSDWTVHGRTRTRIEHVYRLYIYTVACISVFTSVASSDVCVESATTRARVIAISIKHLRLCDKIAWISCCSPVRMRSDRSTRRPHEDRSHASIADVSHRSKRHLTGKRRRPADRSARSRQHSLAFYLRFGQFIDRPTSGLHRIYTNDSHKKNFMGRTLVGSSNGHFENGTVCDQFTQTD